ncbi:ferritin-like domain-containing protein [Crassisporium funariophilum]|nr:ferritin-like domain-containing protein [Crassisporium funariophilum]
MRHALLSFIVVAFSAHHVVASPLVPRQTIDDSVILNYALTLEHLENAFYHDALAKFDAKAFTDAGLPPFARGRFQQVADHEAAHVAFLSGALGDKATKACKYNFPYTDPKSFAALSAVLEGVGVSAYTGAAQFITNKDYLTAAASVLATEARHASWVAAAVNKVAGWSGALDVPLSLNQVYTLAAAFIVPDSCPSTNPDLPVKAFPTLTLSVASPGKRSTVKHQGTTDATHIAFFTGLSTLFAPIENGEVTLPEGLTGQVYAVACNSGDKVTDDNTVAGPAILLFEMDSNGNLIHT